MSQRLELGFNYTFSHALDEVSNAGYYPFDLNTDPSILFPQNPNNIRQYNYGNADYDIRHYISANYVWDDLFRNIFKKGGPEVARRRLDPRRNGVLPNRATVHGAG